MKLTDPISTAGGGVVGGEFEFETKNRNRKYIEHGKNKAQKSMIREGKKFEG